MRGFSEDKLIKMLSFKPINSGDWNISLTFDGNYVEVINKKYGSQIMRLQQLQQLIYGEMGDQHRIELQPLFTQLEQECFWDNEIKDIINEGDENG